jgi:hypothetical protein
MAPFFSLVGAIARLRNTHCSLHLILPIQLGIYSPNRFYAAHIPSRDHRACGGDGQASATLATLVTAHLPEAPLVALSPRERPALICGTPETLAATRGVRPLVVAPDGQPLWFTQVPSVLTPDYAGAVSLSNFVVTGDVQTIRFGSSAQANEGDIETWTRTETQLINGHLVSVFNPT